MRRATHLNLSIALCLAAFCLLAARAQTVSWDGENGDWDEPTNWVPEGAPPVSSSVLIERSSDPDPAFQVAFSGQVTPIVRSVSIGNSARGGVTLAIDGRFRILQDGCLHSEYLDISDDSCRVCGANQVPNQSRRGCDICPTGFAPGPEGTECSACDAGYFGVTCQACPGGAATACNDHGVCSDGIEGDGVCSCAVEWDGPACDVCASGYFSSTCQACPGGADTPCSNHGTCDQGLGGSGVCDCESGWSGGACDSECPIGTSGIGCNECDSGYFGPSCTACPGGALTPCNNHGSCGDGKSGSGTCSCDAGWKDASCDACAAGYFGPACEACPGGSSTPCNGHGTCDEGLGGSGTCSCETGWDGPSCTVCAPGYFGPACEACPGGASTPCADHGTCDEGLSGSGTCSCEAGWSGSVCAACAAGYFGPTCEACPGGPSAPCNSRGTCDEGLQGSGMCSCEAGWSGLSCTSCDTGYFGSNCLACPGGAATPCSNHGTCSQGLGGSGVCDCDDGWRNSHCGQCEENYFGGLCTACPGLAEDNLCDGLGACEDGTTGIGCRCFAGAGLTPTGTCITAEVIQPVDNGSGGGDEGPEELNKTIPPGVTLHFTFLVTSPSARRAEEEDGLDVIIHIKVKSGRVAAHASQRYLPTGESDADWSDSGTGERTIKAQTISPGTTIYLTIVGEAVVSSEIALAMEVKSTDDGGGGGGLDIGTLLGYISAGIGGAAMLIFGFFWDQLKIKYICHRPWALDKIWLQPKEIIAFKKSNGVPFVWDDETEQWEYQWKKTYPEIGVVVPHKLPGGAHLKTLPVDSEDDMESGIEMTGVTPTTPNGPPPPQHYRHHATFASSNGVPHPQQYRSHSNSTPPYMDNSGHPEYTGPDHWYPQQ